MAMISIVIACHITTNIISYEELSATPNSNSDDSPVLSSACAAKGAKRAHCSVLPPCPNRIAQHAMRELPLVCVAFHYRRIPLLTVSTPRGSLSTPGEGFVFSCSS